MSAAPGASPVAPARGNEPQEAEFDRQLSTLEELGYPTLAGESEVEFRARVEALRPHLPRYGGSEGRIPFVLVAKRALVPTDAALGVIAYRGKPAVSAFEPGDLPRFAPIAEVSAGDAQVYLCLGIDTAPETLNVTPEAALPGILAVHRSPLTIDEGIAVITQFPGILKERNAFSLAGSRRGDRRVPALWMSQGRPKLGWCWAGNPHTWLATASCAGRAGP